MRAVGSLTSRRRPVASLSSRTKQAGEFPQPPVVAIRLAGGLGNQMFQYAMGRRISVAVDRPLCIDIGAFRRDRKRAYGLAPFKIRAEVSPQGMFAGFNAPFDKLRRLQRLIALARGSHWVWALERSTPVPDAVKWAVLSGRSLYLEGYWQSPMWFKEIEATLRAEFVLQEALPAELERVVASGDRESTVGVHVRRGDFVEDLQTASVHSVCTRDYYERAARLMRERIPGARFVLFSDEPAWVHSNLHLASEQLLVPAHAGRSACVDLVLLSMCRHLILSNSTFGWWAAWMSEASGGTRIVPDRWFADGRPEPEGLIPPHWVRIGANGSC